MLEIVFIDFLLVFFMVKHYIGHILGMGGPTDLQQKSDAGPHYVTLTFDLTHHLNIGFAKSKFK